MTSLDADAKVSLGQAVRELYGFMTPRRRRQLFLVFILMLVGGLAEILTIGAVIPFLTLLTAPDNLHHLPVVGALAQRFGLVGSSEQLFAVTGCFIAAAVLAGALRLQLAWSSQSFTFRLGHDLAIEVQRRILHQPYSYHIRQNSSQAIASLEKVQTLVFSVILPLMQSATGLFSILLIVLALMSLDPFTATIAAVAFTAIYAAVSAFFRKRLERNSQVLARTWDERVQLVQESLGGIRDIIIDDSQALYIEAFRRLDWRLNRARAITLLVGIGPKSVVETAGMVVIALIALALAGREGGIAGALPVLGALALGAQRLLPLTQQVYYGWTSLAGSQSILGQVLQLLALPVTTHENALPALPLRDRISVDAVSFSYAGRATPAVEQASFSIPKGARVGLIGKTGSGKSTLADLLMGLLEPTAGQIRIDGVPLNSATRRRWQKSIAHVPQAIFLADTTIARNIAFGVPEDQVDHQRVIDAATRAQLHDFITGLSDGYATSVGERGVRLSGGQRQRVGIARAIYKQAPVLVLDEATSALDDATETVVMEALDRLGNEGRTIIMVAHRLSTVARCDIVIRLDEGRIVDIGSYASVIGANPIYRTA